MIRSLADRTFQLRQPSEALVRELAAARALGAAEELKAQKAAEKLAKQQEREAKKQSLAGNDAKSGRQFAKDALAAAQEASKTEAVIEVEVDTEVTEEEDTNSQSKVRIAAL